MVRYTYRGVNEEAVPVEILDIPAVDGLACVEVLEDVGGYRAGEWLNVAWSRLTKANRTRAKEKP